MPGTEHQVAQRGERHIRLAGINLAPCIYTRPSGLCPGSAPFNSEHWFSRGLGNFRGFEELKEKICQDCNNLFGRELEDIFLHSGPEALFREIAGGNFGRKSHEKQNIEFDDYDGSEVVVEFGDADLSLKGAAKYPATSLR
jgi:hypothetical protein